jgi:coiled-coil and C2 domain-containing protein 2A
VFIGKSLGLIEKEWISDLKMDPNDPRNKDIIRLKQLIYSIYTETNMDIFTIKEYWSSREFFRIKPPKWLDRILFGAGVKFKI